MKVAKSIGLLYKLNRFLPETILKTLYTSHSSIDSSYGNEAWHGTYQNNTTLTPLTSGWGISPPTKLLTNFASLVSLIQRSPSSYSSIDTQLTDQCINNCTM